ncbi:SDR family oxidoreductase [Pectobacterium wasabiae]|uniref:DltE n=1 Tax=Pectobacterium wasabiae TaxID=55208 RepID=A0AAW3EHD3_9GAMM|nr:SDR family NAD(P)-dependent oxidoreductase [Pectobacterium wasabiae]AOR61804.1 oxidoreductase [Pectobacterium wasabiae CFBP 3304]EJS95131.1 Dehydrogenase protein DltE [Pectobacterium wasabiae CFBP 3304]KFX08087.1 DltE [Pectobacterium wasabiae]KGA30722.1 DltE [Pectobacterium wasabiae]
MNMSGNTILITGGTSGIGRGLAEAFHDRGNRVIILGRRQDKLDEITAAHSNMRGIALDVRDVDAIEDLALRLREEEPGLNVLINNAGISREQSLVPGKASLSVTREIIDTNVVSVINATAVFLPQLAGQQQSTIITTTSGLGFVPRSNFPTYCASKAFLHSWLQSLRVQLKNYPIEVLELVPPYVQTELISEHQLADPHAMPLDDFVEEVMALLTAGDAPNGEILVERVQGTRFAEQNGDFNQRFAIFNNLNH